MLQKLSGLEYLKCEIACMHDKAFEKGTWDARLAHYGTLDLSSENTFKQASNGIGLRAAVLALNKTMVGEEIGYMVSLDACSSGLQILSLLVSCPTSWDLCGGDDQNCVDSYTTIYDAMHLHGALTRKEVKKAIMTSLYGSTATPERTFGDNVDVFYETMMRMAPGAWDLNQGLQELWDNVPGSKYSWVLPDNFHACIETKTKDTEPFTFLGNEYAVPVEYAVRPKFHKGLGPNLIHSIDGLTVREMFRRCYYDKAIITRVINCIDETGTSGKSAEIVHTLWTHYQETGFLSARILDYLHHDTMGLVDPLIIAKLIQTLPEEPFQLVSIHDCFKCHPNYGNDLRQQYNNIMADINDSTLLVSLASQVAGRHIGARKVGKIDRDLILEGNYLLA